MTKIIDKIVISIHAPHRRGDEAWGYKVSAEKISIHAPHRRGDSQS